MSLRIEIVSNIVENSSKLDEIESNFISVPYPFQKDNIINWWNYYGHIHSLRLGGYKKPIIVFIYKEKKLYGVLPLLLTTRTRKKFVKIKILEFFSQSFCGDFLDIIQSQFQPAEFVTLVSMLKKKLKFDYIHLNYLHEDSLLLQANIGKEYIHAGKVLIPINESYDKVRKTIYSKNLRHSLNKSLRRINDAEHDIKAVMLEGENQISKYKEQIKKVSLSKLNDSGMHSVYQDEEMGNSYFNSLVRAKKSFCSIYLKDKELISYNMGFVKDNVVYALDASYNRNFASSQKIGLGLLAYDRIVEYFSGKYSFVDMGFGLDDYKFRFSKKTQFTRTLLIKGNTLKSIIMFNLFGDKLITTNESVLQIFKNAK